MDFWEGFLLGPLWSDTDYETRRHAGQLFGIGAVVWFFIALIVLFPDRGGILISPRMLKLAVVTFVSLTLISPFLSRIYFRYTFPVKVLILVVGLFKTMAGMLIPVNILLSGFELDLPSLQDQSMIFLNEYLGDMIDRFTDTYQGLGMIIGIAVGGLSLILMGIGIVIVSLITPRLIVAGEKCIQWVYDSLLFRILFHRVGFSGS